MWYFHVVPSKFARANSNFQNEFPFCVPVPLMKREGVANIFHARYVILKMSDYSLVITLECGKVIGMPSLEMKKIFMLSNNKFLGKCWYGGHPWIRLAMECERMVEKE